MTIQVTDNSKIFTGNGSTGPFTWTWRFLSNSHIVAARVDSTGAATPLVENTDYTLTGAGTYTGGTLTLVVALAVGEELRVRRETPMLQPVDLRSQGDFFPSTYEDALDYITMFSQDSKALANKSLRISEYFDDIPSLSTTETLNRAGMIIGFDDNGNPVTYPYNPLFTTGTAEAPWIDTRDYVSIATAVAAAGSLETALLVADGQTVAADLTIPANLTLWITHGGSITVSSGKTLTINGPFKAGLYECLSGTVLFGQGAILEGYPEWFPATNSVGAIVAAVRNNAIVRLSGTRYAQNVTIPITWRQTRIEGRYADINTLDGVRNGAEIYYTGTGAVFELGSDDSGAWDANTYDGMQGFQVSDVQLKYGGSATTALNNGVGSYGTGTYGIKDWRGGDIFLTNVNINLFEHGFWGIQSDINRFENCLISACHIGIYAGPRSDQFTINEGYFTLCDTAIMVDSCNVRMINPIIVGCGSATDYPIDILTSAVNNRVVTIDNPWFEKYQGFNGQVDAYLGVGVNTGYNSAINPPRVFVHDVSYFTTASVTNTKYIATIGVGFLTLNNYFGDIANITAIVSFTGTITAAGSQANITGNLNTAGKLFVNNGTGTPSLNAQLVGNGSPISYSSVNQYRYQGDGSTPKRDWDFSIPLDYSFQISHSSMNLDNAMRVRTDKRFHTGGANGAPPPTSTWDGGDIATNIAPVAGNFLGYVCTVGGTQGEYGGGKTATADGSATLVLSAADATIKVGMYLLINSVVGIVVSNSGTTLVLNANVTAGSGLAIAYRNATFKTFGAISA